MVRVDDASTPAKFEQLYAVLLDAIPSSMLVVDAQLRIASVNSNFLERSQRTEAATLGLLLSEVFPPIILEHTDIERRIREVFKSGKPVRGQRMTYRAPSIPIRIYYYSILPIALVGQVRQVMLLMEDVTEQVRLSEEVHRVERHLASVVASASDIVLSTDIKGRILTWNSAAERLSGLAFDDVCGRSFFDYCAPDRQQEASELFMRLHSSESQSAEWLLMCNGNGDGIPVSWVFSPMRDERGKTVGVVAVGRDLTERRKLENELRQSQKLAALGVMAGGIAHEIRNPLAACSSAAQFLQEDGIEPAFRAECAAKIEAGIQRASLIIENLLRFARPSPEVGMVAVDLAGVLRETLALIASQAKVKKIAVQDDLGGHVARVRGVPGLLQQVFLNMFLNSINAMPGGGILRVSMQPIDGKVAVEVADTGTGIAEADLEKVFDPFHTTSPVGKGTGLGLSICYSIVQQHVGSISVRSTKGRGSTFTVRLPLL